MDSVEKHFLCEQGGHNPSHPCNHSDIENQTYPSLIIFVFVVFAMLPAINMVYVVNIKELKEFWRKRKWFPKLPKTWTSYSPHTREVQ